MKLLIITAAALAAFTTIHAAADITVPDGHLNFNQYGTDPRGIHESGFVSAGSVADNSWDLKLFGLSGSTLTVAGGFNFLTGNQGYSTGDVFFDTNGQLTRPSRPVGNDGYFNYANPGYEYAIHFTGVVGQGLSYQVVKMSPASTVATVFFASNGESDPWALVLGNADLVLDSGIVPVTGNVTSALLNAEFGTDIGNNGSNYRMNLDVGFLGTSPFTSYLTQQCGNDDLVGYGQVPEAGTWAAGAGLLGLTGLTLWRQKRRLS